MKKALSDKETLKSLHRQLIIADQTRAKLRDKVDELENKILLPSQKKKYEGKYFKYKNSYSGNDWWWLYFHVVEVKSLNNIIVNRFQICQYGKHEFEINQSGSASTLDIPITSAEYRKALRSFEAKLKVLK